MLSVAEKSARKFAKETPLGRTRRARRIHRTLAEVYPNARCELDFATPFQLLVATVMSAQTTDIRVNQVTPALFAAFPDAHHLAAAPLPEVESIIRPTGFYKAKARNIVALSAELVERFDGGVPADQDALVSLPGTGVKTANVVLGNAFDVPGLTVDTHVGRLARRFGFTREEDPLKVEAEVVGLFPRKDLTMLSHRMIFHGRRMCHSRKPACGVCPLAALCPSFGIGELDEERARKLVKYEMALEPGTPFAGKSLPASASATRPTVPEAGAEPGAVASGPASSGRASAGERA